MCPCALVQVVTQRNSSSICKMSSMLEYTTILALPIKLKMAHSQPWCIAVWGCCGFASCYGWSYRLELIQVLKQHLVERPTRTHIGKKGLNLIRGILLYYSSITYSSKLNLIITFHGKHTYCRHRNVKLQNVQREFLIHLAHLRVNKDDHLQFNTSCPCGCIGKRIFVRRVDWRIESNWCYKQSSLPPPICQDKVQCMPVGVPAYVEGDTYIME